MYHFQRNRLLSLICAVYIAVAYSAVAAHTHIEDHQHDEAVHECVLCTVASELDDTCLPSTPKIYTPTVFSVPVLVAGTSLVSYEPVRANARAPPST